MRGKSYKNIVQTQTYSSYEKPASLDSRTLLKVPDFQWYIVRAFLLEVV